MSTGTDDKTQAEEAHAEVTLLLTAKEVASLLKIGMSTFWRYHVTGKLPAPVKIGRSSRWRVEEIRAWIEAGCPPREKWNRRRNPDR